MKNKVYTDLTAEEELELLKNLKKCSYCEPDGSMYPSGMICKYCNGKHFLIEEKEDL